MRAEREALSLIHFLRDHDKPQFEWLNAISSDQTLSTPVRQRALQFAAIGSGKMSQRAMVFGSEFKYLDDAHQNAFRRAEERP